MSAVTPPTPITPGAMLECVRRELKLRRRVYPGWIARGRMTQAFADREIETMSAVLAVLERVLPNEPAPPSAQKELFR